MPVSINGNTGVITGVAAGGLPDGCILDADINGMAASKLSGALPAISGAALTGIAGGLSEADSWRISTNFQGNAYHITNNWERFDASGEGKKGTGMTQSGGYFTFPSTGYWYIHFSATFYRGANSTVYNQYAHIRTTTDDSSYSARARGVGSMYSSSGNSGSGASAETIFKCENTSTHKVIFGVEVGNSSVYTYGNTNNSMTNVVFIKLADL